MKPLALLAPLLALLLSSCGKGKTTDTRSSDFLTLEEKKEFLERYVKFRRSYDDLEFHIAFIDGGSGAVPGPSEWDIRFSAIVPAAELDHWIDGLEADEAPSTDWIAAIPDGAPELNEFKWYRDDGRNVGIDRKNRRVLYRNEAH